MSDIITSELITQLLQGALLPIAGAIGQSTVMIGQEWINYWKMKNAVYVGGKAKEYLKQRGITDKTQVRELTAKFGILFLQGASVEDEPNLQDLWAKLIANALDPNYPIQQMHIAFMSILKELSVSEVRILNYLYSECKRKQEEQPNLAYVYKLESENTQPFLLSLALHLSMNEISVGFQNLTRLQLMEAEYDSITTFKQGVASAMDRIKIPYPTDNYKITLLGAHFLEACF